MKVTDVYGRVLEVKRDPAGVLVRAGLNDFVFDPAEAELLAGAIALICVADDDRDDEKTITEEQK